MALDKRRSESEPAASFKATATDVCDAEVVPEILSFDCFQFTKKDKRIDKTESCLVSIQGDRISILDSGGVGNRITWQVRATDGSGNSSSIECGVDVVRMPEAHNLQRISR